LRPPGGDLAGDPLPDPLFVAGRARAILTAMLGAEAPGDEPDLPALIEAVARGRMIEDRRRLRLTLRAGSEVLIDTSAALLPFALDTVVLRRQIQAVAGGGVTFRRFAGCPTGSAGTGTGPRPWPAYQPPVRPTCVLVVSDLGAARTGGAGHASVREWLAFARLVEERNCRLRVLVPYPLGRIPPVLRAAMNVVSWQESTSVRSAVLRSGRP